MEFLVIMITKPPDGTTPAEVADMRAREAAHTRDLAGQGRVLRPWRPPPVPGNWLPTAGCSVCGRFPGPGRYLGHWQMTGAGAMRDILTTLPLASWLMTETVPLTRHPGDPAGEVRAS